MIKKLLLPILILISIVLITYAAPATTAQIADTQASSSPFNLLKDWRTIAVTVTIITVILISLAYMAGMSFDIPELKAWAATELEQSIATVLIIIAFVGVMTFLDTLTVNIITNSGIPLTCTNAQNCAVQAATVYLDDLIQTANDQVLDRIKDGINAARTSGYSYGASSPQLIYPIPLLQIATSGNNAAGYILDFERNSLLVEHIGNILSILYAQRFFISQISFNVAPVILVLGIVARSFFVTRKLGGLLIAMAIGVMYVLPLMYVANWITLNITLFGDSIITPQPLDCPAVCKIPPPKFYSGSQPIANKAALLTFFGYTSDPAIARSNPSLQLISNPQLGQLQQQMQRLEDGTLQTLTSSNNGRTAYSCEYAAGGPIDQPIAKDEIVAIASYCPYECRELPYPMTQACTGLALVNGLNQTARVTKTACAALSNVCKVTRYVNPASPNVDLDSKATTLCPVQCRTIPPLNSNCAVTSSIPVTVNYNQQTLTGRCVDSKNFCLFTQPYLPTDSLTKRPVDCRYPQATAQQEADSRACPASTNAVSSCVYVLPAESLLDQGMGICDRCIFAPPEYTFNPPIYNNCPNRCGIGNAGSPLISPSEFARRTKQWMVGRPEIISAATLVIPAYVLPLLDILVVLMFIRSFSTILGGDIEIPGLAKIL